MSIVFDPTTDFFVTLFPKPEKPSNGDERRAFAARQYLSLEGSYPDHMIVFRIGQSYESFSYSARHIAAVIDIHPDKYKHPRGGNLDWIVLSERVFKRAVECCLAKGWKVALFEPRDAYPMAPLAHADKET